MLWGGHQCHEKKYTSHNEVSTWQNHNNNWNGKSKREKGTPSQRFLFNVTTRLSHWHRAWRGLCGLGECLVRETVPELPALLYCWKQQLGYCMSFCFCGHVCVCVFVCVSACATVCATLPACLFAYICRGGNVCKGVRTLCSTLYTVCMYPSLKCTDAHCQLFFFFGTKLGQLLFPCFYKSESFLLQCLSCLSLSPLKH